MYMRITTMVLVISIFHLLFSCQKQTDARSTHESLHGVLWMQRSAEYKALCFQAYQLANAQLRIAVNDKNWTAALEQLGNYKNLPPAVILDVDETVLDNSPYVFSRLCCFCERTS